MPLIEGIGDEVTLILGGFLLCIILMFAWLSTHTADIPLLREVGVIVVELSQRRSRAQNTAQEERLERDTSGSLGHESTLSNSERQQYEVDNQSNETHETLHRTESASDNIVSAADVVNSTPPLPGESTDLQPNAAIASTSTVLASNHTEILAGTSNQTTSIGQSSEHKAGSNSLSESETFVPAASVLVDDNKGFVYPSEDEVRQRRVQYFEANRSANGGNEAGAIHSSSEDSKSTSLSETSTSNSDNIRTFADNVLLGNLYIPDETETAGGNQEHVSVNVTSSRQVSAPTADSSNVATSSLHEDISDSQIMQDENSTSKIRVKLKYMNETQRLVYAEPLDTIGEFRRTHFQEELQDNKWVRFIYNGQDLRDDARTLQACNIGDNSTMHCLITAQVQPHLARVAPQEDDEDSFMGAMMYPLLTVIILIVWYFRFTYKQYFSAMSTVCLIGISFLLALTYISSLRTADRVIPAQRRSPSVTAAGGSGGVQEEHQHVD